MVINHDVQKVCWSLDLKDGLFREPIFIDKVKIICQISTKQFLSNRKVSALEQNVGSAKKVEKVYFEKKILRKYQHES